jgi:hypothetical protein
MSNLLTGHSKRGIACAFMKSGALLYEVRMKSRSYYE